MAIIDGVSRVRARELPRDTPHRSRHDHPNAALWRSVGLLLTLALLEIVPRTGILRPADSFPPLSTVVERLAGLGQIPQFWPWAGATLAAIVAGFALAQMVGLGIGLVIGSSAALYRASITTLDFLRAIPPVALIPVIILLLPVGVLSQTLLAAYSTLWVVIFQVVYGRRSVNVVLRETGELLRFTPAERFRYVIWPSVLPSLVTGARIGVSVSLALVIVAGLVMGGPNLGNLLNLLRNANDVPGAYALVLLIGLAGLGLNAVVVAVERAVLGWHPSVRGTRR